MSIKTDRTGIIAEYRMHEKDCGSTEVQIALLTDRIKRLTEHGKTHPHDQATKRGLLVLVGRRNAFIGYLKRRNPARYEEIREKLGLRK